MKPISDNVQSTDFKYLETDISLQDLEQGMVNAARLVCRYGSIYWPVVERLQNEIDVIEKRDALLAKLLDGEPNRASWASFG
jgi:hypothetical protein